MKEGKKWKRILYTTAVIAFILGAIDPLEGSVLITAASLIIAIITWTTKDRHRILFLTSFIMIVVGVFALFYLSSLGGFGGNSNLSWWWGITILPYPVAWIATIILLIIRAFKKTKQ